MNREFWRSVVATALGVLAGVVAAAGTTAVAVAGFTLSYDAIRRVGIAAFIRPDWAWLLPVSVDGAMAVATVTAVVMGRMGRRAWYPWLVVVTGAGISVGCNALHAYMRGGGIDLDRSVAMAVSAIPAVMLALSVHLLVVLVDAAARSFTPATAPVDLVVGVPVGVAPTAPGRGPDGARTEPPSMPAPAPSRTNGPSNDPDGSLDGRSTKPAVTSGRTADGRRQATLDDVRLAVAAGTPATRDALGKRLRADGLSAGNDAVGALLRELRNGRTADGPARVNGHQVAS